MVKNNKAVVVFHCFAKLIIEININNIIIKNKKIRLILMNLPYIIPIIYKDKIIGKGLITLYLLSEVVLFIGHKLNLLFLHIFFRQFRKHPLYHQLLRTAHSDFYILLSFPKEPVQFRVKTVTNLH